MEKIREKQHSLLVDRNVRSLHTVDLFDTTLIQTHITQSTKSTRIEPEIDDDNVCIVWLTNDTNNDIGFYDTRPIKIFYSKNDFIIFICELQTMNVFVILDYTFVSDMLSILDDFAQIIFVYVLNREQNLIDPVLTNAKRSVRQLSNNINDIFQLITSDINTCVKDSICKNIMDLTEIEESTSQVKNPSFIWYHKLIDCLLNLNFPDNNAKIDLIEYCRQHCSTDDIPAQNQITNFENEYSSENAIRWYTKDSFLFRLLNKTMRTRDINQIFQFRYYIIDLQRQLEYSCSQNNIPQCQTVYRGQQITQLELKKLSKSIGKYISINTYLSTTRKKEVALYFVSESEHEICHIIYEIDIQNVSNIADKRRIPICVDNFSQFPDEAEVIFPITSTFLVISIEMIDKLWYMKLKLTDDNEYNSIKTDFIEDIPLNIQFVELYISSNGLEKGEQYVNSLIEDLKSSSNYENMKDIFYIMGRTCSDRGHYERALFYFKETLANIPSEDKYCAKIYTNLANVYINKCEYDIARQYINQALEYEEQLDPIERASLYETFSCMYREVEDFDNALYSINQALDIHRRNLSPLHHLISIITCLARIYFKKSDFKNALRYFQDALNIELKYTTSTDKLNLINLYAMIGFAYLKCNDKSLAMTYLERSMKLIRKNCNPTSSILIYHTLAEIYNLNDDIEQAYDYAKKAFDIYDENQNLLPKINELVARVHITWATVNSEHFNWNFALDLFVKTLKLTRHNNYFQMLIYFEMGRIYFQKDQTNIALLYFKHALRLIFKRQQSHTYSDYISNIFHHISRVYKRENSIENAIFYVKLALKLQINSNNPNFTHIISQYGDLIELCPKQINEYIEKIRDISNNSTLSIDDKCSCENILGNYYENQKNFSQALTHCTLYLQHILACMPIRYNSLFNRYEKIVNLYYEMNKENLDIDGALVYFEKIHDIYIKLSDMKHLPIQDKKALFVSEKYFLENINQSVGFYMYMANIYYKTVDCYTRRKDHKHTLHYLQLWEKLVDEYNGHNPAPMANILYSNIGFQYKFINYYDKAIECFEKRIQYLSDNFNDCGYTYYIIGDCHQSKNDFAMALSKYKIALTFLHNSQVIDYSMLLTCYKFTADTYYKQGNYEYASKYYEQAVSYELKLDPIDFDQYVTTRVSYTLSCINDKRWNHRQQLEYALEALEFTQCLQEDTLVTLYREIAILYLWNEKFYNALFYFNEAFRYCTPLNRVIDEIIFKMVVFVLIGNLNEALELSKRRINLSINSTITDYIDIFRKYIIQAKIYRKLGKYKRALKSWKLAFIILRFHEKDGNHLKYVDMYETLALIYLDHGQLTEARNYCFKAQSIHFSMTKHGFDSSISCITLGLIQCRLGKYYSALDYFGRAWEAIFNQNELNAWKHILYNYIGYAYFKLNQVDLAMKFYLKSLSFYHDHNYNKHPDISKIYRNIGLYYEQIENNYSLALTYYKSALELVPNKKHPHYIRYQSFIATLKFKIQKEAYASKAMCSLL